MFLKDLIDSKDYKVVLVVCLFSIILNAHYILFNLDLGIYCSDVYIYLLNALYFTGTCINSASTIYLSPIICFLTAILFNLGLKDQLAICIVTSLFSIIGNIGFYILLKTRFSSITSLCGVILYSAFAINLTWLSNGSVDISAVSITIWIVLFLIIAVKRNPAYYQALFPTLVIGFFTRYTVVLIIPALALYYIYHKGFKVEKNDLKYIARGIIFGAILSVIIVYPLSKMGNQYVTAQSQISSGIIGNKGSTSDLAYNTNTLYYLSNFLNFISSTQVIFENRTPVLQNPNIHSIIITLILAIGSILYVKNNPFKLKKTNIAAIIIFLTALLTFTHISSFITILLVFLGLFILKDHKNKNGLVMISWILAYLIFFSYFNIKVNRYIIPTIPPLVYLILASCEQINEKIDLNKNIIPLCLIVLFLIQAFTFTLAFTPTDDFIAAHEMSDYVIDKVPDYASDTIGVYNMRPYNWYLGENITGIESNNQSKIESANITYYISDIAQNNLSDFRQITSIDNLYLYKRSV